MRVEHNKRKLIVRIVLARISAQARWNSYICYYVRDRRNKYLPWFPPGPIAGELVAPIFLERSQSVGQTNFVKATRRILIPLFPFEDSSALRVSLFANACSFIKVRSRKIVSTKKP